MIGIHWEIPVPDLYYCDGFYAECRAYGRLQEMNVEYAAVRCFGYITLSRQHEDQLKGEGISIRDHDDGDPDWPIYAIVKEYIDTKIHFTPSMVRSMIRNLHTIHEVGIYVRDIHEGNYLNGVLIDFSQSRTV